MHYHRVNDYAIRYSREMIFFGKGSLDFATDQFLEHYHKERPHQGLDNDVILKLKALSEPTGGIACDERLGGLLKSYRRVA